MSIFTPDHMIKKPETGERIVTGMNTIIHCHHYNARIQRTVEGVEVIDGKSVIRSSAENCFHQHVEYSLKTLELPKEKALEVATDLYPYLGFGQLDFSREKEGGNSNSVEVYVEDNGPGIPKEQRDKIFDAFFTTKDPNKGTGLGLSILARIIKQMDGEVFVEKSKIGGARFVLKFELSSQELGECAS